MRHDGQIFRSTLSDKLFFCVCVCAFCFTSRFCFGTALLRLRQICCSLIYVVISYHLTGNYVNMERFCIFALFCVAGSICAQSWGFFVGATLSVKVSGDKMMQREFEALS